MNHYATYVVTVRFKHVQSLQSVVIEDPDGHVVRAGDNPVLPGYETSGSHGKIAHFEALDQSLALVVPNVDVAIVQGGQHPRFAGVEVTTLDPVRPGGQAPLDVQAQRLKQAHG